jgi:hypothetical protein
MAVPSVQEVLRCPIEAVGRGVCSANSLVIRRGHTIDCGQRNECAVTARIQRWRNPTGRLIFSLVSAALLRERCRV